MLLAAQLLIEAALVAGMTNGYWDGRFWRAEGTVEVLYAGGGRRLVVDGTDLSFWGLPRPANAATWDGRRWAALGAPARISGFAGLRGETYATTPSGALLKLVGTNLVSLPSPITDARGNPRGIVSTSEGVWIAGDFTLTNGLMATNVVRWDGSNWHAAGALPLVRMLRVVDDHPIAFGDQSLFEWRRGEWERVARIDGAVVLDVVRHAGELIIIESRTSPQVQRVVRQRGEGWEPVGTNLLPGRLQSLAVWNGRLVVAGRFEVVEEGQTNEASK
jgi:hypothetical protein